MKILKFGGTSVADPGRIKEVARLVRRSRQDGPLVVVVSAFAGVTSNLVQAAEQAAARNQAYLEQWRSLGNRHLQAARELAAPAESESLSAELGQRLADLRDLLHGVYLLREASPRTRDSIHAYGERLSARIVAAALRAVGEPAQAVNARELIVTDHSFGRARVELETSYAQMRQRLDKEELAVVTGFIGATPEGHTTTLGRGGSDYTAALLGAGLRAAAIELWTDVDGVLRADPRRVPDAEVLPRLSYDELMELSHFGAKVVYPPSIHPARSLGIPLWIRNTLRPEAPGTLVERSSNPDRGPVCGISSIPKVSLLRLEGDGMVGEPGVAGRLFSALARRGVSVILISQGSSEHSICFAVSPEDTELARQAVEEEFALERQVGLVDAPVVERDLAVVAVVGEGMRDRSGLAGRLFAVLGARGISVRAIAQGSSERNISLVVSGNDEAAAVRVVHDAFFAAPPRTVRVALAGVGTVGGELLQQLAAAAPRLLAEEGLALELVALLSSRKQLLALEGLDLHKAKQQLTESDESELDLEQLISVLGHGSDRALFVDATASEDTTRLYRKLAANGIGVVAANKRFFAGPAGALQELQTLAHGEATTLRYETTAGAGLPILSTLRALRRTGDRILRLDGVLSGTLNAVLDGLASGEALSQAVRRAHAEGLTEPHPWDDLSGEDVARKLVILGRCAGFDLELDQVQVEALLPTDQGQDWAAMDLEQLWPALTTLDQEFADRRQAASAEGKVLRYLGTVGPEGAQVSLQAVDAQHPAHALAGPDNLVAIYSQRYSATPLVVRGPGAGPAVTAAGLFADLLDAARGQD